MCMPRGFILPAVAPFRLDFTVWTLRRRPSNTVDRWDGEAYRRVLTIGDATEEIAVRQLRRGKSPRLEVTADGLMSAARRAEVTWRVERLLGTRIDLAAFYRFAAAEPKLGEVVEQFRGCKPPRFTSVFEALVNAIAGQQVTLSLTVQLLNKLAARYGLPSDRAMAERQPGLRTSQARATASPRAFPRPEELARARLTTLRGFGFTGQKARAMTELSRAVVSGALDLESLAELGDRAAVERLISLNGVGRWTAEYALLRGLGRTHIFPGDDVGARNLLRWRLGLRRPLDYAGVARVLRGWREFGGLIYFHMLLDGLAATGELATPVGKR
jgi:DNA-3-methyladenine glycosylase II